MASEGIPSAVPTMKLKIVSNTEEVGTHMFDNIPVDTSLGWIKRHLQTTLPSHPPAENQRILYQARFLDDDSATLASIFGTSTPDERAFHLVIRAPRANAQPGVRTASAPPQPATAPTPILPDAQRHGVNIQPVVHTAGAHGGTPWQNIHQAHTAIHNNLVQQHQLSHLEAHNRALHALQSQMQQQIPAGQALGGAPMDPTSNAPAREAYIRAFLDNVHATIQRTVPTEGRPQQQQGTTEQGSSGIDEAPMTSVTSADLGTSLHPPNIPGEAHATGLSAAAVSPGASTPQVPHPRAGLAPLQMQGRISQQVAANGAPTVPPEHFQRLAQLLETNAARPVLNNQTMRPSTPPVQPTARIQAGLEMTVLNGIAQGLQQILQNVLLQQQRLRNLETAEFQTGLLEQQRRYADLDTTLNSARDTFDTYADDPDTRNHPDFLSLRLSLDGVRARMETGRLELMSISDTMRSRSATAAANATHEAAVRAAFSPSAEPPRTMLLRAPSGEPHALLVGPSGAYRTPELSPDLLQRLFQGQQVASPMTQHGVGPAGPAQAPTARPTAPEYGADGRLLNGPEMLRAFRAGEWPAAMLRPDGARLERRRRQGARLRLLMRNFLTALWLFIRIAGMLYLFGGISGDANTWFHWRSFAVAALVLAGWVVQQPRARRHIDAVRVHFEQLFGVQLQLGGRGGIRADAPRPAAPVPEAAAAAQPDQQQPVAVQGEAPASATTAVPVQPQEPAAGGNTFREQVRGVERAFALFAASLVPGMGEGIVQARQTAEADARRAVEEAETARLEAAAALEAEAAGEATETDAGQEGASATPVDAAGASVPEEETTAASTQVDVQGSSNGSDVRRVNRDKDASERSNGPGTSSVDQSNEQAHLDID